MDDSKIPDVIEAIRTRRSVRIFSSNPVPDDLLKKALAAAMAAPSAGNEQPWHFIVLRDKSLLQKVTMILPNAPMARQAAAGPRDERPRFRGAKGRGCRCRRESPRGARPCGRGYHVRPRGSIMRRTRHSSAPAVFDKETQP